MQVGHNQKPIMHLQKVLTRLLQPTDLQTCCGYFVDMKCHSIPVQFLAYKGAVSTPHWVDTGTILRLDLLLLGELTVNENPINSFASNLLNSSWLREADCVKNERASRALTSTTTARTNMKTLIFQSLVLILSSNDIGAWRALLW
jgi:hypothetical protein